MNPKEELSKLKTAMASIVSAAKAAGREITQSELTDLEAKAARAADLQQIIDRTEKGASILDRFKAGDPGDGEGSGSKGSFLNVKATARAVAAKAIGTSSDLVGVEFLTGVGSTIDRAPTSLLQAIPVLRRSSPVYTYLRESVRTMNAGPVAEGGTKPTSIVTLEPVESRLKVFAHVSEKIPRYLLEDHAEIGRFIENEFTNGLDLAIQTQIVSGTGLGENLLGWNAASGILSVSGASLIVVARIGIQRLTANSRVPAFIAVAPEDWTTALTTRNTSGNFDWSPSAPVDEAELKLWGVPVIESPAVTAGTAWVVAGGADSLSTDGKLDVRWSDSTADDFTTNSVRLRVETRVNHDIRQASGIVKATITP